VRFFSWGHQKPLYRKKETFYVLTTTIVIGILIYLVVVPLAFLLISTIKSDPERLPLESGPIGFTNFIRVYLDPSTYELIGNTFVFALGSVIIGIPIAAFLAFLLERTNLPYRNLIYTIILIPIGIPGMIFAIGWIQLLSPNIGAINLLFRYLFGATAVSGPFNIYSVYGMCFVEGLRMVPTAFLMMAAAFRNMNPDLEMQGRVLGAGSFAVIRRITVPLLLPAVLAATIYSSIIAVEAFEIPGVLGLSANLRVLSTRIYYATHPDHGGMPNYGYASTIALVLLFLAVALMLLYNHITKGSGRYVTVTGRGYRPDIINLGRWKWLFLFGSLIYFSISTVLPVFILLWGSLLPNFYQAPSIKALQSIAFDAYRMVFQRPTVAKGLINTLLLMLITATLTMALSTVISWLVVKRRVPGRSFLDTLGFLPLAIPSVVIGLVMIYVYLTIPIPIYGTIWIIILALTTRYIAFGCRTMNAAFLQIHSELEEAGVMSGASWSAIFRRVTLPLVFPAFLNGWLWVALHAMRELSIALMLFSPSSIVISTLIWSFWQNGRICEASTLSIVFVLITIVLVPLLRGRMLPGFMRL
jgi:iron(III) transport system permease protein